MGIFGKMFGRKKGASNLGVNLDYLNAPCSLNYQVSCNYLRRLFLAADLPASVFLDNLAFAKEMVARVVQKCSEEGRLIPSSYINLPITFVSNHDRSCFGYIVEFNDASEECDCNFIGMMVENGEKVYYTSEYYAGLNSFSLCCFCEDGSHRSGLGDASPRTFEEFKRAVIK